MSKKNPASDAHLSALENPTAAFPIGSLAKLDDQDWEDDEDEEFLSQQVPQPNIRELDYLDDDPFEDELSDDDARWGEIEVAGVHPMLLVLSLLGGGLLAAAVLGFLGFFFLYYN